jgi:virulence factor Mce-like protein
MRRPGNSLVANPMLVGAVTVLVTVVAVFLAYNANNGLPFVPTTDLKVQIANGANLVRGNEVRSGGYRIGVVTGIAPKPLPGGGVGAELTLRLDESVGRIPRDSRVVIRNRSALGLKYVELHEGGSPESFGDGDTVPPSQAHVPVDIDDVFNTFDEPTRRAQQVNLQGFGDALAGRGGDLGRAIEELPRFFGHLEPVMGTLAAPATELDRFFVELGDTVRVLAPVAAAQARLFTTMADTFAALDADPEALQALIEKSPPTLDVATGSLRAQRPFLSRLADFSHDFETATHELRGALPDLNAAVSEGVGVQRRAVALNRRLTGTLRALDDVARAPTTPIALRQLTATVATLNPQVRFLGPYQTVCNYWNGFWTTVAEHFSEDDLTGHVQRAMINSAGQQDDGFGSMGANAPANGQRVIEGAAQYAHGATYGAAVTPDGRADCETGQRGYLHRNAKNLPPKYHVDADSRSPGAAGPTFSGRERVPPGQTFTHIPQTGPYAGIPASEAGDR